MSVDQLTEILAAQAEALNAGKPVELGRADQGAELASLLGVAARVKRALRPAQMAPVFRARLRDGLALAARHQQAQRLRSIQQDESSRVPLRGNWGWLIGAAALGSAAGVIAVVLRSRGQTKSAASAQVQN